jgi:hypothetical protein
LGAAITVTYHGAPGNARDTICMFKSDSSNIQQALAVQNLNGTMDGVLTFTAPLEAGTYNFRMLANGLSTVDVSNNVQVFDQAALNAFPVVADLQDTITVAYCEGPASESEWIGLYKEADPDGQYLSRQYLGGNTSGTLTFFAPQQAGTYNFRMGADGVAASQAVSNAVQVEKMIKGSTLKIVLQIGSPTMTVNGISAQIDPGGNVAPVIGEGRTFLPVRAIAENLGGTVQWKQDIQQIRVQMGNKIVYLWIGYAVARVDGNLVAIDAAPRIVNGRAMAPLRFVAESLGADVQWDASSQTVTVTYVY